LVTDATAAFGSDGMKAAATSAPDIRTRHRSIDVAASRCEWLPPRRRTTVEEFQQVTPTQKCFSGNFGMEISYISIDYAVGALGGRRRCKHFQFLPTYPENIRCFIVANGALQSLAMTLPIKAPPHLRTGRVPRLAPSIRRTVVVTDVPLAVPDPIFNRKHATSSCVRWARLLPDLSTSTTLPVVRSDTTWWKFRCRNPEKRPGRATDR
jgi:hypothetical protein